MDSLGPMHVHSALCNYGLGGNFGTANRNDASVAPSRTYNSNVRFGGKMEEPGHLATDLAIVNSHYSLDSAPKVTFGANLNSGWVPFGAAPKAHNGRLNVVA